MTLKHYCLLLLVPLAILGCARNPVTGEKEWQVVSEKEEIQIGNNVYHYLQQMEGGPYQAHPNIQEYVVTVGKKLAAASDRPDLPYQFVVLNDSVPNAWALPGGKIAIYRGLLVHLDSEASLAAVLAHEIVHAAARHGAKALERDILLSLGAQTIGAAAGESVGAALLMSAIQTGSHLITMKYSRSAESQADHYGMVYMQRAGYNPLAAVDLQKTFLALEKGRNPSWMEGLFASHPPSKERMEANAAFAKELGEDGIMGKEAYHEALAPLLEGQKAYDLGDEALAAIAKKNFPKALDLARQAQKIEPKEGLFSFLEGSALLALHHPDAAKEAFDRAIDLSAPNWAYLLARAQALQALGDISSAKKDAQESFRLLPTQEAKDLINPTP